MLAEAHSFASLYDVRPTMFLSKYYSVARSISHSSTQNSLTSLRLNSVQVELHLKALAPRVCSMQEMPLNTLHVTLLFSKWQTAIG